MFWHNFKYSLKILLKNKILIFWTFAFPILLGIFFNMAFSDIEKSEKLDIINIAIIENDLYQNDEIFKETFKTLSDQNNKDRLFNITYTNLENAKDLLEKNKITGFLTYEQDNIKITVNKSGINETIFRYVVDEVITNKEILKDMTTKEIKNQLQAGHYKIDYEKIYQNVSNLTKENTVKLKDISNKNLSYTMIEYYTLIAMACLYGGTLSMYIVNKKIPNMDKVGKRTAISPVGKEKTILGSLLASYLVQLLGLALLFVFTIFILKVDYGNNLKLIILLSLCGSLAGLALGIFVSTMFKTNENAKMGILIAITMAGCFLSGMMGITMKYIIDKNIPILNIINPASMITDGFYALYYYNTIDRYLFNIVSLLIFSAILILISYLGLRRQKYDNI